MPCQDFLNLSLTFFEDGGTSIFLKYVLYILWFVIQSRILIIHLLLHLTIISPVVQFKDRPLGFSIGVFFGHLDKERLKLKGITGIEKYSTLGTSIL